MNSWECGVCGYVHKDENVPGKCPVCEAPAEKFAQIVDKESNKKELPAQEPVEKNWTCTVCGYGHFAKQPPETCPVCSAVAEKFAEVAGEESFEHRVRIDNKQWKCTVCGYIHEGPEPPEKCPVCRAPANLFIELDKDGKEIGSVVIEELFPVLDDVKNKSLFNTLTGLLVRHHLHPISVHFPNGILPVVVSLLAISIGFNLASLEVAAFYNLIAVLLALPLVLLTGFLEWQKRYKGAKTAVFIIKIICAIIVLFTTNVLVFWRVIDPLVAGEGSPHRMIYLGIAGLLLAAAGLAGHLGGKLVFAARK